MKQVRSHGFINLAFGIHQAGIDIFPISLVDKYFNNYWNKMGISRHEFMEMGMSCSNDSGQNFNMGVLALKIAGKIAAHKL